MVIQNNCNYGQYQDRYESDENNEGIIIREWRIDPRSGELNLEDLNDLVCRRTRLVCFSLCSNIVGTMNDVKAITAIAHNAGALAVADGVSFAPHRLVDINKMK